MFISTSKLMGGLGNYLFQIASAYAVALRDGKTYVCDVSDEQIIHKSSSTYATNIFRKIHLINGISDCTSVPQVDFSFRELPKIDKNTKLIGYFQSEKFFKAYRKEILELFQIDTKTLTYLKEKYEEVLKSNTCSIHVRRGDYLNVQDYHKIQDLEYYRQAIERIGTTKHYVIFSDDIEWCEQNFDFLETKTFVKGNLDYQDLYLMSYCKDNIICSSSFSWWGAWLNENIEKTVIAPKTWFGVSNSHLDTSDLYCEGWVVI